MDTAPPLAMTAEPAATLEYASGLTAGLLPAAGLQKDLLTLSVLSGLCVGSCFLVLWQMDSVPVLSVGTKLLHFAIFGTTLWLAVRAGGRAKAWDGYFEMPGTRRGLDLAAGVGLAIIGIAPVFISQHQPDVPWMIAVLGLAYLSLACSTPRHLMLYKGLSRMAREAGKRGLGRTLSVLGTIKFVYEGIWLLCCAIPLIAFAAHDLTGVGEPADDPVIILAFGALFGAMGFTAIWVAMIVVHARCASLSRAR